MEAIPCEILLLDTIDPRKVRRKVQNGPLIIKLGGPHLTSVCVAVYFTIYTFFWFYFIPRIFCSTRASTTKNVIFWVLTLYPLISANIPCQLVPKFWRHAPGHCACHRPISNLRWYLIHLQIRHKIITTKGRHCEYGAAKNRRPIGSLWASLHHFIISNSYEDVVTGEGFHYECGANLTAVQSSV